MIEILAKVATNSEYTCGQIDNFVFSGMFPYVVSTVVMLIKIIVPILLIIFGMSTILSVFNINIIPGTSLHPNTKNIMLKGFLIGITNPIIIVFWGSILTTKFIENKFNKKEQLFYCIGIVLSTLIFQTFVALLGSTVAQLIPPKIKMILNITIGIYLIIFGFQRLKNKPIKTRRKKK